MIRKTAFLIPSLAVLMWAATESSAWAQGRGRGDGKGGARGSGGQSSSQQAPAIQRSAPAIQHAPAQTQRAPSGRNLSSEALQQQGVIRRNDGGAANRSFNNSGSSTVRRSDRDDRDWDRDWSRRRNRDFAFGLGYGALFGYGPGYGYGYSPWSYGYSPWYGGYGYSPWYSYGVPIYDGYADGGYIDSGSAYYSPQGSPQGAQVAETSRGGDSAEGTRFLRRAEEAFRNGRYDEAVRLVNHAAVESPGNGRLFLFMGQALFAIGQYGPAAGAIHQGMALLDPSDWGSVVRNFRNYYGNANDYTDQLRKLERFVGDKPDAVYAHFLVGYQYGYLGYPDHARNELNKAVALESRDELAGKLLEQFGGEAPRVARDGEVRHSEGTIRDGAQDSAGDERRGTRDRRSDAPPPE